MSISSRSLSSTSCVDPLLVSGFPPAALLGALPGVVAAVLWAAAALAPAWSPDAFTLHRKTLSAALLHDGHKQHEMCSSQGSMSTPKATQHILTALCAPALSNEHGAHLSCSDACCLHSPACQPQFDCWLTMMLLSPGSAACCPVDAASPLCHQIGVWGICSAWSLHAHGDKSAAHTLVQQQQSCIPDGADYSDLRAA